MEHDTTTYTLTTPLPDEVAVEAVESLKQEADRYWSIDPNRSLELADQIMTIGQRRKDERQIALGLMARGDALKYLGRLPEAWEELERAGDLFESAGDEVGWARTRIGRLHLGPDLNRVADTLADAERARAIFTRYGEKEKLIRLNINVAYVHTLLGNQRNALDLYRLALDIAKTLGEAGEQYFGMLYMNFGFVHGALGDFPQALANYERAREIYIARDETRNLAAIELDIAHIAQAQGHYRRALRLLYGVLESCDGQFPLEYRAARKVTIECYLNLNRYEEACDLARKAIEDYRDSNHTYDTAHTLLHLAAAEAGLGRLAAAQSALDEALPIYSTLGATTWTMITRLRRGQVALKQGDLPTAYKAATQANNYFRSEHHWVNSATATLLLAQVGLASGDLRNAAQLGNGVLNVARRYNVPSLRYATHLLLGHIAQARASTMRAIRHYRAAMATIERVQRRLTITLRPNFLEGKSEAWRELIALYLGRGQVAFAFETLERAKSQVLLGYLVNREHLRWVEDNDHSLALIEELKHLRDEHQWFYGLAHESQQDTDRKSAVSSEQALLEVALRERRMRAITEQLYLDSSADRAVNPAPIRSLKDIQRTLDADQLLIEFYTDGQQFMAFVLDGQHIAVHELPLTVEMLNRLLAQLQVNLDAALKESPHARRSRNLNELARRILKRLHEVLIAPLDLRKHDPQRLVIVPYGALHYLPFHLLHDGSAYLIEKYEVVVLPAAGLATQPTVHCAPGALILAHSWEGRLPNTFAEAQMVKELFGGKLRADEQVDRTVLQGRPTQILHIAAHGRYRLDQPDLSYIQLADGQLYSDDLLQHDLRYELVTLSACETGRVNVAADEELIGIGRGFLYAGAGALILSLWRVADDSTVDLMQRMYRSLKAGASKASALRLAQRSMLAEKPELHPAFWGAFQLIGDARPLSAQTHAGMPQYRAFHRLF